MTKAKLKKKVTTKVTPKIIPKKPIPRQLSFLERIKRRWNFKVK